MSKENNLKDYLTDLADAIREVEGGGDSNRINPQDFADRIRALPVRVVGTNTNVSKDTCPGYTN